ncbi:polysaccharide deacetylase family protein [Amycolatopsis nigrescens]|uniref:polysaccharide deacetylase family protein n=1 Tax=Amycolatopsis nigrescens TaxID=381445 RepID=UPI00039C33C1|nr:polysaccharide deacetylase family protein [Amycolatopsis nigrescens]
MPASVVTMTVHGIGSPVRPLEPGEDRTWVSVGQFEQVLDAVAERPSGVRITFDDGNASDVEIALPRLVERGLRAEFFLLAGRIGAPGMVDAAGVAALLSAGMTVGSHGWAHRDWRRLDAAGRTEEFVAAPRLLGELTGRPVTRVAVPFGSYDRRVLAGLRRAGVTTAYTSDGGAARPSAWLQSRTSLRHDIDPQWTQDVLAGTPGLRRRARRACARLVKRTRG